MKKRLAEILEKVRSGRLTPARALEELQGFPYCDLDFAKVDHHREVVRGAPEIVFGLGKTPAQIARIGREILEKGSNLLVTRVEPAVWAKIRAKLPGSVYNEAARTVTRLQDPPPAGRGTVVVLTAGTSDIPVAEEAAVTLEMLGNETERIYDVGVAGLHRLLGQYERLRRARVLVAVAGMEGALPSVVAGLVKAPVIAVPTSVGYGASFKGLAALLAMLNACPGGVAVVNIDNGFGAAFIASQINHL
ncbi:MAG TPA: nickel pincer cofactor biosynthesis protein LarB [Candidatus Aminicenantes bacterium]|nr:nickel pincer cofactor biosynthesis protein LarB [Candidatus Aminicenantes bacterium]HRY65872.1 nickel pincer cofactor biosynthesis protein LarB [Candidatus Aminicenantes bacterium]HRZ72802.1 nickel pincer cofactor biosynthesis protein LarB [Candidatus Aminicenantes bacterium]